MMAKIRVRSATFEPNKVANPNSGIPKKADFTLIRNSGSTEIKATTIKPIMYFESLKLSATFAEYVVAIVAPLTTAKRDNKNIKIF